MNSKRQWSLLTALACVAVLVAGFMLLVQPQSARAQSVSAQAQTVQSQRNNCAFTWRRCKSRAATLPASRSSWTALSNSCPPDRNCPV